jgi:hypothetical protein
MTSSSTVVCLVALRVVVALLAPVVLAGGCTGSVVVPGADAARSSDGSSRGADGGGVDRSAEPPDSSTVDRGTLDGSGPADGVPSDGGSTDAGPPPPPPPPPPPMEPDIDALDWAVPGYGVGYKDTQNPRGNNVFIGYAGYQVTDDQSRAWVTALYRAWLRDRGVRHVFAVRGPRDVTYSSYEIGNTRIVATMLPAIDDATHFIAVAGHSSGSYVAHELFGQLFAMGYDPEGKTRGKIVYYDLDGARGSLDDNLIGALRRAYFVSAHSSVGDSWSLNASGMMSAGATWPQAGGFLAYDASDSGCNGGASFCLHVTLVTTRPHDLSGANAALDYTDFDGRPVNTWYLDAGGDALLP